MKYYKVIKDKMLLGVASTQNLGKPLQKKNGTLLFIASPETEAQYIAVNNNFYHDLWMCPYTASYEIENASVIEIRESEYKLLSEAFKDTNSIAVEEAPQTTEEEEKQEDFAISEETEITLDFLKNSLIKKMSKKCNEEIVKGIDIVLSDEKTYHFSLTLEDQINLLSLSSLLNNPSIEKIPYHADNENYIFFSKEDFQTILSKTNEWKILQEMYFNGLKGYIKSINTIDELNNIFYGMDIPEEYQNSIYKSLV